MRRTALLALPLLALTATPSGAAPSVGAQNAVTVGFAVPTAGGKLTVQLVGTLPSSTSTATEPRVRVLVIAPDGSKSRYTAALKPGELQVGNGGATLTTRLGSLPLRVVWVARYEHGTVSLGAVGDALPGMAGSPFLGEGGDADATVRLGRATCKTADGIIGTAVRADADASSYGAPLSQALRGLSPAECFRTR